MKLPDKVYDVLKWLCLLLIPGIGLLYSKLSGIWGLPYGQQVYETFQAVQVFMGGLIGVSAITIGKENQHNTTDI